MSEPANCYDMNFISAVSSSDCCVQSHLTSYIEPLPSGYKDSLLRVPSVPLVVGPVLGSNPPPESFRSIYWPRVPDVHSWEWQRGRIEEAVARRVFQAAALRLTEAVTFVDGVPREALADLYRAADVYSISTIEAYGIALLVTKTREPLLLGKRIGLPVKERASLRMIVNPRIPTRLLTAVFSIKISPQESMLCYNAACLIYQSQRDKTVHE